MAAWLADWLWRLAGWLASCLTGWLPGGREALPPLQSPKPSQPLQLLQPLQLYSHYNIYYCRHVFSLDYYP